MAAFSTTAVRLLLAVLVAAGAGGAIYLGGRGGGDDMSNISSTSRRIQPARLLSFGRAISSKAAKNEPVLALLFVCFAFAVASSGCRPPVYYSVAHTWEGQAFSTHILETDEIVSVNGPQWYYEAKTTIRHVSDIDETLEVFSVEIKNAQSSVAADFFDPGSMTYPVWGIISVADTTVEFPGINTFRYDGLADHELNVGPNCHQVLCSIADVVIFPQRTVSWAGSNGPSGPMLDLAIYPTGPGMGFITDNIFYQP
jgi:hypothetical protein